MAECPVLCGVCGNVTLAAKDDDESGNTDATVIIFVVCALVVLFSVVIIVAFLSAGKAKRAGQQVPSLGFSTNYTNESFAAHDGDLYNEVATAVSPETYADIDALPSVPRANEPEDGDLYDEVATTVSPETYAEIDAPSSAPHANEPGATYLEPAAVAANFAANEYQDVAPAAPVSDLNYEMPTQPSVQKRCCTQRGEGRGRERQRAEMETERQDMGGGGGGV